MAPNSSAAFMPNSPTITIKHHHLHRNEKLFIFGKAADELGWRAERSIQDCCKFQLGGLGWGGGNQNPSHHFFVPKGEGSRVPGPRITSGACKQFQIGSEPANMCVM